MLDDVSVALGVTGSIAAVRTVELAHELQRRGASVRAVMTDAATDIVDPNALEYATGADVVTELTGAVEHVAWCGDEGWADVLLIAPATANTVGKIAHAIDDTTVTTMATTAIGAGTPVVVAPAMHQPMYDHPGVTENLNRLDELGIATVPPYIEEGKAKLASDDAIALETARAVPGGRMGNELAGTTVVIIAGGTCEELDPLRVLTNYASGQMGRAVARASYCGGATVTLIHGTVGPRPVEDTLEQSREGKELGYASTIAVDDVNSMREAVMDVIDEADIFVSAAAVGDFSPVRASAKIRSGDPRELTLEPTAKIIEAVRERRPDLPIVGFKAETATEDTALIEAAQELRVAHDCALVVANDGTVMGEADTRVLLVEGDEGHQVVSGSKWEVGATIAAELSAIAAGD